MRFCPHCQTRLPNGIQRCPGCGARYWEPGSEVAPSESDAPEDSGEGCLAILLWPLAAAVLVTVLLVLTGLLLDILSRWESQPLKALWVLGSVGCGVVVYLAFARRKKDRFKGRKDGPGI